MKNIRALSKEYIREITDHLILEREDRIAPDFKLDKYQKKLIESKSKFVRVIAPAGSGKTRTLLAKAVEELKTNRKANVLCLTFTNAAVNEFNKQSQILDDYFLNRLHVSTLNAFGYRLLKEFNKNIQIVVPNGSRIGTVYFHIKNLIARNKHIKYVNKETYSAIFELSNFTKGIGFDHESDMDEITEMYEHVEALGIEPLISKGLSEIGLSGNTEDIYLKIWIPFWKKLTKQIWESNIISIEDQKYWTWQLLANNKELQKILKQQKFTHILIDEFQDINLLDLNLIKAIVILSKASVVIVGDDDQCIYEWRGCTSNIIRKPNLYFKSILDNSKFEEIELSRNYRCPRNIIIHAANLIQNNKQRISKKMIPVRTEDANIRVVPLPAAYLTLSVVDELVADIAKHHPEHTVAIVGRKKFQLIPIQILLTRRGTEFAIDLDLNLFEGDAFKNFRKLLELPITYKRSRKSSQIITDFFNLLNLIKKRPVNKDEKEVIDEWLSNYKPETLKDAVEIFGWYDGKFKGGFVEPKEVSNDLHSFLSQKTVIGALNSASEIFKGLQKDFVKSKDDIFFSDPPFSHLADLAVGYESDFKSFLNDIDKAIQRAASNNPQDAKIELMTALRAKGREFDTVIVLDVNDTIWPNKKSKEAGRIEEERRLFYVTVTRSKNNLLLFESGRVHGQQLFPSPFINELQLPKSAWLRLPDFNKISNELLTQLNI
jgi:DNA helicase-2/ATP-dependent DNA helicase PcrA